MPSAGRLKPYSPRIHGKNGSKVGRQRIEGQVKSQVASVGMAPAKPSEFDGSEDLPPHTVALSQALIYGT